MIYPDFTCQLVILPRNEVKKTMNECNTRHSQKWQTDCGIYNLPCHSDFISVYSTSAPCVLEKNVARFFFALKRQNLIIFCVKMPLIDKFWRNFKHNSSYSAQNKKFTREKFFSYNIGIITCWLCMNERGLYDKNLPTSEKWGCCTKKKYEQLRVM